MIKFFRKIRQNLLTENKTGKYFKYAIGEIILVVIGILIALQTNNWNENNKAKSRWKSDLLELKSELNSDLIRLDFVLIQLKHIGALEIGNGIWRVFYRNIFLGYFNENELRTKKQSVRLETNLV